MATRVCLDELCRCGISPATGRQFDELIDSLTCVQTTPVVNSSGTVITLTALIASSGWTLRSEVLVLWTFVLHDNFVSAVLSMPAYSKILGDTSFSIFTISRMDGRCAGNLLVHKIPTFKKEFMA